MESGGGVFAGKASDERLGIVEVSCLKVRDVLVDIVVGAERHDIFAAREGRDPCALLQLKATIGS